MIQILLGIIQQLNSSVFVLLGILVVTGILLFKVGKWSEKFLTHEKKIDKVESLSEKVIELKTKVELIYQNTNPNRLIEARSPISLTSKGRELSDTIRANEILNKHLVPLEERVNSENPKNAYDIQMSSLKVAKEQLISMLDEEDLNLIKDTAYQNGLIVDDLMGIFGVLLRNHILNKKGLPIADIDRHQTSATS